MWWGRSDTRRGRVRGRRGTAEEDERGKTLTRRSRRTSARDTVVRGVTRRCREYLIEGGGGRETQRRAGGGEGVRGTTRRSRSTRT
jgi:hypothetical protein